MNLKDYYAIMSRLYMNQMIICAFAFILILVPLFHQTGYNLIIAAGVVMLILMIFYLFRCMYFSSRCHSLPRPTLGRTFHSSRYLLLSAPSSETAYRLYTGDGYCKITITVKEGKSSHMWMNRAALNRKNVEWEMVDHEQSKVWTIVQKADRAHIHCGDLSYTFLTERRGKKEKSARVGQCEYLYRITRFSHVILKNGHPVLTVQKGMMPLAFQAYFDANTPLIHLDSALLDQEKMFFFFLLVDNL